MDKMMHGTFKRRERVRAKTANDERITDPLTGLLNRRGFLSYVENAIARLGRTGKGATSVVFIDIDHFKNVNDKYGHDAGDGVLKETAKALTAHVRKTDKVGRWGGEELCVLLDGTDGAGAYKWAEEFRKTLELLEIKIGKKTIRITASFGAAAISPNDAITVKELISRADEAMYSAKDTGRNRAVLWTEFNENIPGYQFKLDLNTPDTPSASSSAA